MTAFSSAEQWGHEPIHFAEIRVHIRRCHCACGVDIVADSENPTPDYQRHVGGARHQGWWSRARRAWQGEES